MIAVLTPHVDIAGGVKSLATYVVLMRQLGEEAWLVNCGDPKEPWCRALREAQPYTITWSQYLKDYASPTGWVLVPDAGLTMLREQLAQAQGDRVLVALGWCHLLDFLDRNRKRSDRVFAAPSRWQRPLRRIWVRRFRRAMSKAQIVAAIANSAFTRTWLRERLDYDPIVVPTGIDGEVFFEEPAARVPGQILVVGPKGAEEAQRVMRSLSASPTTTCRHAIDLDEAEMAIAYRRADILLAFGREEGLPRVVLEAMRSGCAVVGYDGGGGREFMHHGQSALVARGLDDFVPLVHELLADRPLLERIRDGGREEASRYTLATQRETLASTLAFLRAGRANGSLSLRHALRGATK